MPLWFSLAAAVATIGEGGAALRASCGEEEAVVARLAAGTPVQIRFAVNASIACYKVSAGAQQGYVAASAVRNPAEFERQRQAGDTATVQVMKPETRLAPAAGGEAVLRQSWELIQANQPREALALLEPAMPRFSLHPQALAVAGLAAYRADNARLALEYWDRSLALQANADVQLLRERAQREVQHDRSGDSAQGLRVLLRYEGARVTAAAAREMVAALDEEAGRLGAALGCRFDERVIAVVQTPAAYRNTMQAAEWSGGLYDGRIHVPLLEGERLTPALRRTFAHELVHACLANLGRFPAWLHEGLAQRYSGETLTPAGRALAREAMAARGVPPLQSLGQSWSGLGADNARLAYAVAYLAAEQLEQNHGAVGLRAILSNPGLLEHLTPELNKALGLR